jgi:sodium transport system ATP-binding protein
MIRVQSLAKTFHDKKRGAIHAVNGVSFEVPAGQIFGLLGSNGAGKTTTLRILATILKPTGGSAELAGFDIVQTPAEVRRRIGFLSGDMGHYHRLSPREILTVFGELNGITGNTLKQRVNELIEGFEMGKYANARSDTLSTGMRQRSAIARTLIHDPPVLILDEPTSGLDVPTSRLVERFILEARAKGKCVVLSTHVMEEAEYLCDRIGVVHAGRLEALGTMDELRQRTGKHRLREVFLELIHAGDEREARS